MKIIEENASGYAVECECGKEFLVLKSAGVAACHDCGRDEDPRCLKYKWARYNNPRNPDACQAL